MECIAQLPRVSRADPESFNRCRFFLQILFLSEITTADGTALTCTAWQGTRPRFSPLLRPYEPNPGPKSWRRLLAKAFLHTAPAKHTTPQTKDLTLTSALRKWLPGSKWLHRQSILLYSATTGNIYQIDANSYLIHRRLCRSRHQSLVFSATPTSTVYALPTDSIPVDELSGSGKLLAFLGILVMKVLPSLPADALTFPDYVLQLPLWDQRLLSDINLADTTGLLAHLQSDVPLYLVSDGGADADSGSFGALTADVDKIFVSLSCTREGIAPGSFRAESYGCLAILRLIYHLVVFHAIPPPVIHHHFFCD
jgi:hypothetical protein